VPASVVLDHVARRMKKAAPAPTPRTPHLAPHVLLGVTAGIAAYKSLELVRLLRKAGCEVQVVMTRHATKLVGPESFRALSGRPVALELFPRARPEDTGSRSKIGNRRSKILHVDLAAWADLVVVAPATANVMAKLCLGLADDLLSTLLLAVPDRVRSSGRFLLAPAMNTNMWQSPSVRKNALTLTRQGYRLIGPDAGELACGTVGPGRMLEAKTIADACLAALSSRTQELAGFRVVVTAGPTEEPLDPVRVITNRSSGRMGIALAEAFARAGASVGLVCGPVAVPLPQQLPVARVRTSEDMRKAVLERVGKADVLLMCAAVSDFRPARVRREKSHGDRLQLALVRTKDILEAVSRTRHHALVIGFSLDPSPAAARRKLTAKRLDLVVANDYSTPGSDSIKATLFARGAKPRALPRMSKTQFAEKLVSVVAEALEKRVRK